MCSYRLIAAILLAVWLLPMGLSAQSPEALDADTVSTVCGRSAGTRFNLEPRIEVLPQTGLSVDFLPNRVAPGIDLVVAVGRDFRFGAGYYVSRDSACTAEFEGPLPVIPAGFDEEWCCGGSPVVVADPVRDAFFVADHRMNTDDDSPGVAVFRSPASTLLSSTACPGGTHASGQPSTCWPTKKVIISRGGETFTAMPSPHLALDERTSGVGAGNVYVVTDFIGDDPTSLRILLAACQNDLSVCSTASEVGSGRFPHVAVRPDGEITLTWIDTFEINYLSCTPTTPPTAPTCSPVSLVHHETQKLEGGLFGGNLWAQSFRVVTRAVHAHRIDTNGTETYVVWDRCKVNVEETFGIICPDADVVMKASNDNGLSWSGLVCVSCSRNDQFFPAIATDRSRNIVNIAYYTSQNDWRSQHRLQVFLKHIAPGAATPDPISDTHVVTTLLNSPSAWFPRVGTVFPSLEEIRQELFHSIGVAARGTGVDGASRAYVHFTYHNIQGTVKGISVPDQNNHLSRLDY